MNGNATGAVAEVTRSREQQLLKLNEQYVRASLTGDVEWFRNHLAEEFVCIESDGSVLFRDGFLRMAGRESDFCEYTLDYVEVRFYGDVALVRASGSWTNQDNIRGVSRYIDIYVYTDGAWKVVSAQITRPGNGPVATALSNA